MSITLKDISQFSGLDLIAKQLVEGFITGLHRSPYHGFSVEFAEHKQYNFGESTRYIDWKVFARTDRLFTKRFEEETNLRCHLLLDHSGSMYFPKPGLDKIRFSVIASAALANLLIRQRDAVGLTLFSDGIDFQSAQKSTQSHLLQLINQLSQVLNHPTSGGTRITQVLHEIADKIKRRSLVILFTDMFQSSDHETVYAALQHLVHNGHEVLLFHVSDWKTELEFDYSDRPSRFVDLETNETVRINPYAIRENYTSQMKAFYNEVKWRCGGLRVDFVEVDTKNPFEKILNAYLIKRKRMR